MRLVYDETNLKQGAHIPQLTSWPVPHACAQPYHLGSCSHGQLVRLYWGSSAWHSPRVASSLGSITSRCSGKWAHDRTRETVEIEPTSSPVLRLDGYAPIRVKQLSMAATARVIWLCACVRYWPGHGLVYACSLPEACLSIRWLLSRG